MDLNAVEIPRGSHLRSIVSWRGDTDGDGVVSKWSQDLRNIGPTAPVPYTLDYSALPNLSVTENAVAPTGGPCSLTARLNCQVHTLEHDVEKRALDIRLFVQQRDVKIASVVERIDPDIPIASKRDQRLTARGQHFQPGLTAIVTLPGSGISLLTGRQVQVISDSSVDLLIKLVDPGHYGLRIRNGDGSESEDFPFEVVPAKPSPAPALESLDTSPQQPIAGHLFTFTAAGVGFSTTVAEVLFTGPGCAPCVVPNGVLTTKELALLVGSATLNAAGTYQVAVRNGSSGTPSASLSVIVGPAPFVLRITPSSPERRISDQAVKVEGSAFQLGVRPSNRRDGHVTSCCAPTVSLATSGDGRVGVRAFGASIDPAFTRRDDRA